MLLRKYGQYSACRDVYSVANYALNETLRNHYVFPLWGKNLDRLFEIVERSFPA